jgi:hypothetical protein
MNGSEGQDSTRRQWLRSAARWLALGGLAALSGGLLSRAAPADGCPRGVPACGGCLLAPDCPGAKALRARGLGNNK